MFDTTKGLPDKTLEYISLMVNPTVRNAVRSTADKWNLSSTLARKLRDYYTGLPHSKIEVTDAEIEVYLRANGFNESEITLATMLKSKYAGVPDDGADTLIDAFFMRYKRDKATELQRIYDKERNEDEGAAFANLIKGLSDLDKSGGAKFDIVNYSKMDLKEFIENKVQNPARLVQSLFKIIKESCKNGAYEKGWIVQVVAPSGIGKTQFLLNEAVNFAKQKLHVCWIALGDMESVSMFERLVCLTTQTSMFDLKDNLSYLAEHPALLEVIPYIDFVYKDANGITATDLVNCVFNSETPDKIYDVVIIDYDDNLKAETASLYEQGANVFAEMTRLAKKGMGTAHEQYKLVFLATQAKIQYWGDEELGANSAATSSAKQARVDIMLTINANQINPHLGTMCIVKHRHGEKMLTKFHRENYGRIRGIDINEYNNYLVQHRQPNIQNAETAENVATAGNRSVSTMFKTQ